MYYNIIFPDAWSDLLNLTDKTGDRGESGSENEFDSELETARGTKAHVQCIPCIFGQSAVLRTWEMLRQQLKDRRG